MGHRRRGRREHPGVSRPTSASTRARRSTSRSRRTRPPIDLDIYRMGYYGGMGARKVATVLPSATLPQTQPTCLTDAATGLIDCGNWAVSASWAVPADAVSGIYFAKLMRERHRRRQPHRLHRPRRRRAFRPAVPDLRHDVAGLQPVRRQQPVLSAAPGGPRPRVQGQLQPAVHHARDQAGRLGVQRRIPDGALARSQRLQRQLFDGRRHRPPRRARSSSTRCSCRSVTTSTGPARSAPTSKRRATAGVNLAFFSGNEVFWKTRWENSIDDGGTPPTARWSATRRRTPTPRSIRRPRGRARGATRASARRPTAAVRKTR